MKTTLDIQSELQRRGYYKGLLDGQEGPQTDYAIRQFQSANGLERDGDVGPQTLAKLFPAAKPAPVVRTHVSAFDKASLTNLSKAHPKIQAVLVRAREQVEFRVLDSSRGRAAQEKAFKEGRSKARFGQSAHNWSPAIAVDLFPAPYDWNAVKAFDELAAVVMRIATDMGVPLRWGGDWNMDGNKTASDAWDKPHFELHPWRDFAKHCTPYLS
ncbi:M15 family metallopeptidase [Rhizobium sp. Leaf383]|uniref:M15 family metallopeptidase n=1 Tax=Rhizobium sp. Leaf383 TaxID=1736357 RepID=UPI0007146F57|nr:M15 family metallopeptidase [Rhizobium sp. Leaf383]KQS74519.1 hypothetical protein ASG58_16275 [Rhizobium sp. Leaf383]